MKKFVADPKLKVSEFVYKTDIPGLYFIEHKTFEDERGFYSELYRIPEIDALNSLQFAVKQVNLSLSHTNVIRGFHAENWNKLITVFTGEAYCVLVDVRPESPSFGRSELFTLGDSKSSLKGSLFVRAGIANSLLVLSGPANYFYCVDQLYAERDTSNDVAISLFDPDLNIDWPIPREQMIMSERDKNSISLKEKFPEKFL